MSVPGSLQALRHMLDDMSPACQPTLLLHVAWMCGVSLCRIFHQISTFILHVIVFWASVDLRVFVNGQALVAQRRSAISFHTIKSTMTSQKRSVQCRICACIDMSLSRLPPSTLAFHDSLERMQKFLVLIPQHVAWMKFALLLLPVYLFWWCVPTFNHQDTLLPLHMHGSSRLKCNFEKFLVQTLWPSALMPAHPSNDCVVPRMTQTMMETFGWKIGTQCGDFLFEIVIPFFMMADFKHVWSFAIARVCASKDLIFCCLVCLTSALVLCFLKNKPKHTSRLDKRGVASTEDEICGLALNNLDESHMQSVQCDTQSRYSQDEQYYICRTCVSVFFFVVDSGYVVTERLCVLFSCVESTNEHVGGIGD